MLRAVNSIFKIRNVGQKEWANVSTLYHPTVVDEEEIGTKIYTYHNFEDFYSDAKNGKLRGCKAGETFFLQRPYVEVYNASALSEYVVTKKSFRGIDILFGYEDKPKWSMKFLMEHLPAEDFAKLANNRGWNLKF